MLNGLRKIFSPDRGGGAPGKLGFPVALAVAVALAFVLRPPAEEGLRGLAILQPLPHSRESTDGAPPAFVEGLERYAARDYGAAAESLQRAVKETGPGARLDRARLFLGLSLVLSDRARDSLPFLREAARSAEPLTAQPARWYAAQAHLMLDEPEAARALLDDLSKQSPAYARDASRQLLQLRGTRDAP